MSPCLVVAGGEVVSPNGVFRADVVVDHGVIATVARGGMTTPGGAVLVDATGLLVFPGLIDAHVHFQEPGREDWEGFATGSSAAAAGGVTTVVDMPIDCYPPTVTAAAVTAKAERARASSLVDVALWGGLIPSSVGELAAMAAAGVIGFKAFACPSGWDDFPPVDKQSLRAGMAEAARLGLPVALHCERGGHRVADEVGTVRWAGGIAAAVAGRLHAVHLSSAEAVDEARRWPGVTTETCPHYLLLDEGDVATAGATATCHPPIRDADNRAALWERALGGDVDIVASDHSPCPPSWRGRWAGIDGVGLGLPLLLSAGMPPARLAAMGTAAARLLRLVGKGSVAPGFDADLALVDPHASWTVEPATLWTRHRATPFLGRAVRGRVVRTLLRGRTIFELDEGPVRLGSARVLGPGPAAGR